MTDDVSCPDPDEVVTRRILSEELQKFREEFRLELNEDMARHFRAYEEQGRLDWQQQLKGLQESLTAQVRAMLEAQDTRKQVTDYEDRIVRLEARPAKRRVRPRNTPKRRKRR